MELGRSVKGGITVVDTLGSKIGEMGKGVLDGGGTIGIGVKTCNKEGSKEAIRSKEVDEGIEAKRSDVIGLTLLVEETYEELGNQREKVVMKGV